VQPRLVLLVAALALAPGCVQAARPRAPEPRHGSGLADPEVVSSAVTDLGHRLEKEALPWPAHLPRSRDFPELPLARVEQVEDLGRTGADTDVLTRSLEQEVRRLRLVRLSVDEEAVPAWLRDGPGEDAPPPARGKELNKPGLLLRAFTDRGGRLRLELHDVITGDRVARARSR
jgi:hypothetical protein